MALFLFKMTEPEKECFQILELEFSASPEDAKQAYRELVKVWHPDRFIGDDKLQFRAH